MKKRIVIDGHEYEIVENYKDGFDLEKLVERYTDYFENYDYILGDWAYGKLRLKGFRNKGNPLYNEVNNYQKIKQYIKESCAYDCKYFIIEKKKEEK